MIAVVGEIAGMFSGMIGGRGSGKVCGKAEGLGDGVLVVDPVWAQAQGIADERSEENG